MTITVNEKEYEAIFFALNQVETEIEAAADEEYIDVANNHIKALYDLIDKYKEARNKANYFQQVRAEVSKLNRNLRPRDIDRITRKLIKQMQNNEQNKRKA